MTNFYSLREPWYWNANQSGALNFVSTNLTDVELWRNGYTSADLSGEPNLQILQINNNNLTNLVLTGCTGLQWLEAQYNYLPGLVLPDCAGLQHLEAQNNQLTAPALDDLLKFLDASCPNLQWVNLISNAAPSDVGYFYYSSLTNKGVKVFVDGR